MRTTLSFPILLLLFAGCNAIAAGSPGADSFMGDTGLVSQHVDPPAGQGISAPNKAVALLFTVIEQGISNGTTSAIAPHFASRVFVQLRGSEGGSVSATQAYYILEGFLKGRKTLGARFSTFGGTDANPYASGNASFIRKGLREDAQMYVALSQSGDGWRIARLSIY